MTMIRIRVLNGSRAVSAPAAVLTGLLCTTVAGSADTTSAAATARLHAQWRAVISSTPVPGSGCFAAHYPERAWSQVECVKAPDRHYYPAHGVVSPTVGNGNDYAALTTTLISTATGSFPSIKGLHSVSSYSLQLNSQYFASPLCAGAQNPLICEGWQQFIYAPATTGNGLLFMQYWLINYGPKCPSGWFPAALGTDCSTNGGGVQVPPQSLSQLADLQLSGTVVSGGNDTTKLTTSTDAYSTSASDSIVDLSGYWNGAEYNILGNGEDSEATFNKGTKIQVLIALQDGSTTAPTCEANAGTTGETNNLKLGKCTAKGGDTPSITFKEAN
jgi:hypothetical protein